MLFRVFGVSCREPNAKIQSTIQGKPLYKTDKKPDTFTTCFNKKEIEMNVQALKTVRRLFCIEGVPAHVQRHNCQQWVKSIRFLGNKWLLAKQVSKL
jgi:hypothetical protein